MLVWMTDLHPDAAIIATRRTTTVQAAEVVTATTMHNNTEGRSIDEEDDHANSIRDGLQTKYNFFESGIDFTLYYLRFPFHRRPQAAASEAGPFGLLGLDFRKRGAHAFSCVMYTHDTMFH